MNIEPHMPSKFVNQAASGLPGDREILRRELAEFLDRQTIDVTISAVPADPPDKVANWNPWSRFLLVVDGRPRVRWQTEKGEKNRRFHTGELVYLPERSWIQVDREQPCRTLGIVLNPNFVRFRMGDGAGNPRNPPPATHWHHTRHPAPRLVLDLLAQAKDATSTARRMRLVTAVHLLAEHLGEDAAVEMGIAESLFHSVTHYLRDHLGERIDRSVVAAVFDRHPSHISEVFKTYGERTFHQHLTHIRMEHARDMLLHTETPAKAIAEACGYESQSHFGAVFRRHVGHSPAAYRAMHRQR